MTKTEFENSQKLPFLTMLHNCLRDGDIEIVTSIAPNSAKYGDGQWNVVTTRIIFKDENFQTFETKGDVELCNPI